MHAVEILNRCRDGQRDIRQLRDRLARLLECATNTTARLDRVGGRSGERDKLSTFASDIEQCEGMLKAREKRYEAELLAACKIVDELDELESGILYRYFVQGQSTSEIAKALHYSAGYVKRRKAAGIAAVWELDIDVDALLPEWYLKGGEDRT